MQETPENQVQATNNNNLIVIVAIILVLIAGVAFYFSSHKATEQIEEVAQPTVEVNQDVESNPIDEVMDEEAEQTLPEVIPEIVIPEPVEEVVVEENPLPLLNDSDDWIKEKLTTITWRKELLKLVIDDDMIRRLVVFTDNFAQGMIAYEHSPLVKPSVKFEGLDLPSEQGAQEWIFDENSTKRFKLYVELLRSVDVESLVDWYYDVKPLINEAYAEMGYPDDDFTETMQDAITRVLDMDMPKEEVVLIRPSVMYKYKSQELESMSDTDKLLMRIGKENLLVIKSVLLEFSDKLGRRRGE